MPIKRQTLFQCCSSVGPASLFAVTIVCRGPVGIRRVLDTGQFSLPTNTDSDKHYTNSGLLLDDRLKRC